MSFLTPLYLLGLSAISLPILLHLIRRIPRGRVQFSSLMFLTPSPPRLNRRSRLDHWILLLLRAAALALLAAAFARPFLRQFSVHSDPPSGRRVAILIDTSASMRREGLWPQAVAHVERLLADLEPSDDVALLAFDAGVRTAVPWSEMRSADIASRKAAVRRALAGTEARLGEHRSGSCSGSRCRRRPGRHGTTRDGPVPGNRSHQRHAERCGA